MKRVRQRVGLLLRPKVVCSSSGLSRGSPQLPGGDIALDNTCTCLRVDSPLSGDLLVAPVAKNLVGVRDPVAGCRLRREGDTAIPETIGAKMPFMRSRRFYISKDVDVIIQTLRETTKVCTMLAWASWAEQGEDCM